MRSAQRASGAIAIMALCVGLFAILARLVLPACGVTGVWFGHCDERIEAEPGLSTAIDLRRVELERRIVDLERSLTVQQCEPVVPIQQAEAPEILPEEEPEVDEALWDDQSPEVMSGCWTLERPYAVENVDTLDIVSFNQWTICFGDGEVLRGDQMMRSTEGATCESEIPARFNEDGELVLEETADLPCSDGMRIFRRIITCDRTEEGGLSCTDFQPQGERSGAFRMRRQ